MLLSASSLLQDRILGEGGGRKKKQKTGASQIQLLTCFVIACSAPTCFLNWADISSYWNLLSTHHSWQWKSIWCPCRLDWFRLWNISGHSTSARPFHDTAAIPSALCDTALWFLRRSQFAPKFPWRWLSVWLHHNTFLHWTWMLIASFFCLYPFSSFADRRLVPRLLFLCKHGQVKFTWLSKAKRITIKRNYSPFIHTNFVCGWRGTPRLEMKQNYFFAGLYLQGASDVSLWIGSYPLLRSPILPNESLRRPDLSEQSRMKRFFAMPHKST